MSQDVSRKDLRVLLTGASGQVGGDLFSLLQPFAEVIAPSRAELDLSDAQTIGKYVHDVNPQWIINPAAYTAVDKSESEPDIAYAINAEAPRALGETAAELHIPIIHFSTDYVFAGEGTTPWKESDATGPLGVYGTSKLAGEIALAASGAAHLIFRTSWVYSGRGKNFLLTILKLAQQKEELRIVDDQHGAPTWSRDLGKMVAHILKRTSEQKSTTGLSAEEVVRGAKGIYHAAAGGETTWFGFAQEFLRVAATIRPNFKLARLVPVPSSEYPTPARRPANSRLDCSRLRQVFGFTMPKWQESVPTVVAEVLAERVT